MKAILFNAMYTGKYIGEKLGHEAINLFASDNGNHYIYINPIGKIAKKYEIECVLLGELVEEGKFKVIAKATGLKMLESTERITEETGAKEGGPLPKPYKEKHLDDLKGCTYGGVPIDKLFAEETQVLATFTAKEVVKVRGDVYIYDYAYGTNEKGKELKDLPNRLSQSNHDPNKPYRFAKTNPYMYFPERNSKGEEMEDYKEIKNIFDEAKWEEKSVGKFDPNMSIIPLTMVEIMGKENNELAYSNMINYWLGIEKEVLKKFVTSVLKKKDNSIPSPTDDNIKIEREKDNIDLLISYGKTRIIIENKIDASISEYNNDEYPNQLVKYRDIQVQKVGIENVHCFLLAPDYRSDIDVSKYDNEYKEMKYSEILNFFNKDARALLTNNTRIEPYQYEEFCHALEMHKGETDDRNYNKMMRRMVEAVRRAK